jgi:uncharacterized Zn finger protein
MSFWSFRPYVPVAKRREQAKREIDKLKKKGRVVFPIVVDGRKIAQSFWGQAWCENLERYSDFESRLPRGRSYVRNGSVVDLQIARGSLHALVSGSDIYEVKIDVTVAAPSRWKAICKDCAGSVGSLVELLQGKLSKNVMERVCRESDGLFPAPHEIKMSCSCPDWADMCKHVAATLYGAGTRLDAAPELLFTLRGVDRAELVTTVSAELPMAQKGVESERVLADDDVGALFGIDMTATVTSPIAGKKRTSTQSRKPASRCGEAKTASPSSRETEKALGSGKTKKVPGATAAVTTHQKKAQPGKIAAADARKAARKVPDPVTSKTIEKTAVRPEAPSARTPAKLRQSRKAPVGRTRAAKWIGAKAHRARI